MATYVKYNDFVEMLCKGKHDFSTHTFKIALSNGTPSSAHTGLADISELTTANGYTTGGLTVTLAVTESAGTVTASASDPSAWTASGGTITFRYAALYNDTMTTPHADGLIAYWDNGSSTGITTGNTLQVDFGATLFTLA